MKTLPSLMLAASLIATLAVSGSALAHNDEWFDANPPASGGQVRMAGPYHFELLPQQAKNGVQINVTDHGDQKIATAGWSASAVVLAAGKKSRIALKPAGTHSLVGTGALPAGAKIVVSVKDKSGKAWSARFTPGAASAAAPGDGAAGHDHGGHDHSGHDHADHSH